MARVGASQASVLCNHPHPTRESFWGSVFFFRIHAAHSCRKSKGPWQTLHQMYMIEPPGGIIVVASTHAVVCTIESCTVTIENTLCTHAIDQSNSRSRYRVHMDHTSTMTRQPYRLGHPCPWSAAPYIQTIAVCADHTGTCQQGFCPKQTKRSAVRGI